MTYNPSKGKGLKHNPQALAAVAKSNPQLVPAQANEAPRSHAIKRAEPQQMAPAQERKSIELNPEIALSESLAMESALQVAQDTITAAKLLEQSTELLAQSLANARSRQTQVLQEHRQANAEILKASGLSQDVEAFKQSQEQGSPFDLMAFAEFRAAKTMKAWGLIKEEDEAIDPGQWEEEIDLETTELAPTSSTTEQTIDLTTFETSIQAE